MKALDVVVGLGTGALFGAGLVISGMTRPSKVLGFLDVTGAWDASLAFVMLGAIGVHAIAYRWIRRHPVTPLSLPPDARVDARLVVGSALFGVGWGLAGLCPGPALTAVATLAPAALVFVAGMTAGILLEHRVTRGSKS